MYFTSERVSAAADLITAVGVAGAAVVGGMWNHRQAQRHEPHLPRVNASLAAMLVVANQTDCLTFTATIEHTAGGRLYIRQGVDRTPKVCLHRLEAAQGTVRRTPIAEAEVMAEHTVMANGEVVRHCGALGVGARTPETFGYDLVFTFCGSDNQESEDDDDARPWTFTENFVALVGSTGAQSMS